jgi:hypothetical protein
LLKRLRASYPVDVFRWPSLKGEKRVGSGWEPAVNAFRAQTRSEHHFVDVAGAGGVPFLIAGGAEIARSFTTVSWGESVAVLEREGHRGIADFVRLNYQLIGSGAGQIVPLVMQGADEQTIARAIREVDETIDRSWVVEAMAAEDDMPPIPVGVLTVPSIYLEPTPPLTIEGLFEVFHRYAPAARHERLKEWGLRIHEEAGGHELADKVIPFIQQVIAARER